MINFLRGDDPSPFTELDAALAQRLPADGAATVVLVARDGKILFSHGYGLADREKQIPATPETHFRIGSVTKQFTAAAILHLAQENRLSIEDPLAKYFPSYPGGDKITLRQMLNHTSGLHNYTAHADFMARVVRPISESDLVAWFKDDPADFPPGEQFRYSNTNYVLLAQIVEKIAGVSYSDYLQKQFFAPLGMHDTGFYVNATPPDHMAKGYSFVAGNLKPAIDWDMSWAGGAGGLYSTVGDLWRWTEALHAGRVVSADSLREMTTEATALKKETLTRYGMGLYHSEIGWLPVIGHNGGVNGFSSAVVFFLEQKVTIVALGNTLPPAPQKGPDECVSLAAHAFLGTEMAAHAPMVDPAVDPKTYPDYVGQYDFGTGIQRITTESGHLYVQLTGQSRFEIFPSGPDAFFFKVVEAGVVFDRDKSGGVFALTHTQNGHTFTALKLKDGPVIAVADLDAIVGQYQYGPQSVLTVTRRDDQLFAQLTGQPEAPIFPKSAHEFCWRIVPASVEFIPGPDGKITNAIHHQNGMTFTAPKIAAK